MAEDTFIREVDEQMRQDRAQEFWAKYGKVIIALAVLVVLATAAMTAWKYYKDTEAASFGDQYMKAIALSNEGKHNEAIAALGAIGENGSGQYPALARMRIASETAASGDKAAALAEFDAISKDAGFSEVFQQIATLRGGLLAVDLEDYASVEARLSALAAAGGAFRHSSREALGIAAMKAANNEKALEWFSAITNDANSAQGVKSRAQLMLNILAGKGVKADG
ncbi:MAG: tetratricopeptide repeat protein [Salaquimonas sp.]